MGRAGRGVAALVLAGLAGCTATGPADRAEQQVRLEQAKATWAAQQAADYSFVLQRLCYCAGVPVARVLVRGDTVFDIQPLDPEEEIAEEARHLYPPMEGLFELIRTALDTADEVEITYDEATGVPLRIKIDYIAAAVDDELTINVSALTFPAP